LSVLQESLFAKATDDAVASADRARMWVGACRWASGTARQENFVLAAFGDRWEHLESFRLNLSVAFASLNAFAIFVSQMTLFASATSFADTRAQGVGVFARSVASFALTIFFVHFAFGHWWEHHERQGLRLGIAFAGLNTFSGFRSQMSFFASASGNADAGANRVRVFARSVASFAFTVFFVIAAHLSFHRHSFDGRHAAIFRINASAVFVFQVTGFAKATDDAVASADWARVRVGAGGRASGAAGQENFVLFAGGDFRGEGEHFDGLNGFALAGWYARALSISQKTFFAEASDDAIFGAHRVGMGVGAGGCACGAAWIENFVVRACRFTAWHLHGDLVMTSLAILRDHTFSIGVLQESFLTETTDHTLEGTHFRWFGIGAIRDASGSAIEKFGVGAAFFIYWKSRGGDSEPEGTNADEQNVR